MKCRHNPGTTGEYRADCNAPASTIANFCLGDCFQICPSSKCPEGYHYQLSNSFTIN